MAPKRRTSGREWGMIYRTMHTPSPESPTSDVIAIAEESLIPRTETRMKPVRRCMVGRIVEFDD